MVAGGAAAAGAAAGAAAAWRGCPPGAGTGPRPPGAGTPAGGAPGAAAGASGRFSPSRAFRSLMSLLGEAPGFLFCSTESSSVVEITRSSSAGRKGGRSASEGVGGRQRTILTRIPPVKARPLKHTFFTDRRGLAPPRLARAAQAYLVFRKASMARAV